MFWNRSPSSIVQFWQDDAEQNIEAGSTPVIEFGVSNMPSDNTPAFLALQRWSVQRTDVSTPIIPAGGVGPLWMAAMMRPAPRYSQTHAPEPLVLYTGANDAEYLSSVTILHAAVAPSAPDTPRRAAIPGSYFAPRSQPGMSIPWDSLPFLETYDPQPFAARGEAPGDEGAGTEESHGDPTQDWLAWTALLLALFLILLAVVL